MSVAEIHPLVLGTMRLAEKGTYASQVSELVARCHALWRKQFACVE